MQRVDPDATTVLEVEAYPLREHPARLMWVHVLLSQVSFSSQRPCFLEGGWLIAASGDDAWLLNIAAIINNIDDGMPKPILKQKQAMEQN